MTDRVIILRNREVNRGSFKRNKSLFRAARSREQSNSTSDLRSDVTDKILKRQLIFPEARNDQPEEIVQKGTSSQSGSSRIINWGSSQNLESSGVVDTEPQEQGAKVSREEITNIQKWYCRNDKKLESFLNSPRDKTLNKRKGEEVVLDNVVYTLTTPQKRKEQNAERFPIEEQKDPELNETDFTT